MLINVSKRARCNKMLHSYVSRKQPAYGNPDSKVNGANMGTIWGRQDPGGLHVGPINFAIWEVDWIQP